MATINLLIPVLLKSWAILSPIFFVLPVMSDINSKPETMISYKPIGEFHTDLTPQTGAPRQGILQPETTGTIVLFQEYNEALRDLEEYEYIIVIYHLHMSKKWQSRVIPPGSKRSFGLFATRSPNRPNPIGFAVIKLIGIDGTILHVSGIDAFDGTPVLDVKPWLPSIDCPSLKDNPEIESKIGLGK